MKITDLTLSYEDNIVLEDFSMETGKGITCIMSKNGGGKTTLLRYIAGLIKADKGTIVNGPDKPSMCFQEDRLFKELSVLENVMAVNENKDDSKRILTSLGLEEKINSKIDELSGGMKRRAAIARAIAYGGDMLLMDEPFKGIDEENMEKVYSLILSLDIPVIITTHSPEEVKRLNAKLIKF